MDRVKNIHLKKVLFNTSSQFLTRIITSSSSLITTLAITYFLGFYEYGSFVKIVTYVSFFYLILDFGINPTLLQQHFKNTRHYFSHLLLLRLLFSGVLFLIACGLAFILPYNQFLNTGFSLGEKQQILLFALTIFPTGLILSVQAYIQRELKYQETIIPNIVSSLVLLGGILIGIQNKNLNVVLLSFVASQLVLFYFLNMRAKIPFPHLSLSKIPFGFFKNILLGSLPLALMLFFNLAYAKADMILLSLYKSNFEVGIYGFSYRVFEFLIALPTFFANSIYPILLSYNHESKQFTVLVKRYAFGLFAISFFLVLGTVLFSPFISVLKKDFIYSAYPLQILSLSLPFFFLTSLFQWVLIVKNKKMFLVSIYAFSLILNIILNVIFIPRYSYIGSAIITVFCEGIVFVLMVGYLFLHKKQFFKHV